MPTRLVFGCGRLNQVGKLARTLGRRALVVSTPGVPHLERLLELLRAAGVDTVPFTDTRPNPLAGDLNRAGQLAREEQCEVVVGLGGGSAMDTAKGAALMAVNPGDLWEYTIEVSEPRTPTGALPKILVPTTAGTGSEVNFVAVIGNGETKQKGPVRSAFNYPAYAVLDPELTVTLPPFVTASSGFDAFTHALERFMQPRFHPFAETLAVDVMATVFECLPKVLTEPMNLELRSRMLWAATQAAVCVNCRLGEVGLHIFGLPLSALLDTPHGVTLAAMLPVVLADAVPVFPRQAAKIATLLGAVEAGMAEAEAAQRCQPALERWVDQIGMTFHLSDLGADGTLCDGLAETINLDRLHTEYCLPLDRHAVRERYLSRL